MSSRAPLSVLGIRRWPLSSVGLGILAWMLDVHPCYTGVPMELGGVDSYL